MVTIRSSCQSFNKPSESHLEICRYSPIVGDARLLALDRKELILDKIVLQISRDSTIESGTKAKTENNQY